ncbi:MAG: hypothetical protein NT053_10010 [Cyanobacteria bacterium]|nr:hypothetical protein [Cyanobacteriota bacterium]
MLCYVGLHDPAHDWASRRKIETNPVTDGAQIVVILQTVREIQTPYQFSWSRSKCFFVILSIIIFLKLLASPKANKDPAIIAGIRDCFANQTLGLTRRFKINFYNVIHCPYPNGWFANGIELTLLHGRWPLITADEKLRALPDLQCIW